MSGQTPNLRFQRKLEAMTNRADRWQQDPQITGWPGLSTLLREFSDFANDYVRLLKKTPKSISRLPFVLNAGVERLLHEWSILSRACEQRRGPDEDATDENSFQRNLRTAGKFAKNYCDRWHPEEPAEGYQKLNEPIIYFEKLYGISRAIYAPQIPVVSIPLTDYNDPTRWQALAHELGHHIYWNGVDLKTSEAVHTRLHDVIAEHLSASASESKPPGRVRQWASWLARVRVWGPWLEEVFADICGTLFAGLPYVVSAQDLEADRVDEMADLAEDDGEHPCSYLRPLIALQVLREIADHSTDTDFKTALTGEGGLLEKLEDRWTGFCGKASGREHDETGLTMGDLATDIPTIVRAILYEPVWPYSKSLRDLVESYGEALGEMKLTPLSPIPDGMPGGIKNPPPEPASRSFKGIWRDLKDKVEDAVLEEEQKPLAFWSLLLGLELSETAEWHTHRKCTKKHSHTGYCEGKKHRHSMDGGVICCR